MKEASFLWEGESVQFSGRREGKKAREDSNNKEQCNKSAVGCSFEQFCSRHREGYLHGVSTR